MKTNDFPQPGQTEADLELQIRVDYWVQKMNLHDWQIYARVVPAMSGRSAQVYRYRYFRQAILDVEDRLPKEHWDWSIVHELLHLAFNDLDLVTEKMLCLLERHESDAMEEMLENAGELLVNRLCEMIIGQRMPFQPWMVNEERSDEDCSCRPNPQRSRVYREDAEGSRRDAHPLDTHRPRRRRQ